MLSLSSPEWHPPACSPVSTWAGSTAGSGLGTGAQRKPSPTGIAGYATDRPAAGWLGPAPAGRCANCNAPPRGAAPPRSAAPQSPRPGARRARYCPWPPFMAKKETDQEADGIKPAGNGEGEIQFDARTRKQQEIRKDDAAHSAGRAISLVIMMTVDIEREEVPAQDGAEVDQQEIRLPQRRAPILPRRSRG